MMPLAPIRPARRTRIDITKDGALHSCWSGSPKYTRHCERSEAIQERIARESGLLRRPFGAPRNDAANSIRPEYALIRRAEVTRARAESPWRGAGNART